MQDNLRAKGTVVREEQETIYDEGFLAFSVLSRFVNDDDVQMKNGAWYRFR